jgi:ElaB/YqjD/DUF883 family membrane-anchored ribosome-binding protein
MNHDSGINVGDVSDQIGNAMDSTLAEASSVSGKIREKGSELGRKAVARIDERRVGVADGLEGAARGLHNRADSIAEGGERVSRVTHEVADKVDNAARYVRDKDAKDMLANVESMVRAHPTRSLLAVLAVGYLAGRAFRRD